MKNQVTSFIMCAIIGMLLLCACTSATPTTLPPVIISTPTKENPFGTLIASTPLPVPTSTPVDVPTIAPSKNSGRIAFFSSNQCTYKWNVLVANADGSSTTKLIQQPFDNGGLMLSPDGSRIIMLLGQDPDIEYYVMDVGSAQKTKLPIDHDARFYSWSPDSRRIAFTSHSQIYVVNADGTELTNLTNDPADDSPLALSAWSPDGTLIAFTRSIGPDAFNRIDEVFMMRSDGSNQTRLTNSKQGSGGSNISQIAWSPDGIQIAFVRYTNINNNQTSEVYSLKSDSATPIKLATVKFPIRHIAWSPDSSWLIIDGDVNRTGGGDTFRVSLDGSGTTPWLSDGFQAVWSLDGTRVAFATQRNRPRIDIYVMNADGSGQTKLISDDPCNLGPTWIP